MTGRTAPHYGYEVTNSMVPCVQITEAASILPIEDQHGVRTHFLVPHRVVVKRVYGWSHGHAIERALRWMHAHGDPR